jgi:hypothetical protein
LRLAIAAHTIEDHVGKDIDVRGGAIDFSRLV